jgi:predicted TIM-barrel fold metal-dependent hydrolase
VRLADYRPRSQLRLPIHEVARPAHPVIDAHNHLGPVFGGGWAERSPAELADALDESGAEVLVDLDGGQGDELGRHLDRWVGPHPGRVVVFAGLAYDAWSTDARFGDTEARELRRSVERGARGLKVWKVLGLRARDPSGRLVPVDDPRLDPLWATAGELGIPVTIHVADPIAFFRPLDGTNERFEELTAHPDWHFWPPRARNDPDAPGFPTFDELLAGLDAVLGRHPGTTFIGAHVGCAPEDLALVSSMLERHPSFHVDIAARLAELGRQPYGARAFFLRWSDRIVFGTDLGVHPAVYRLHYRFLETADESFDYSIEPAPPQGRWQVHGLALPHDVLRQVYRDNARRLLGLGPAAPG